MDHVSTTQKPKKVINAINEYYSEYNANIHRGIHTLAEKATNEYEKTRIMNCIPDIDKDNLYNNAYLLQYNFENINSICWKKGCFIGQEVTVKMKNRGSLKKKLFTINKNDS